jgi:uncharacterized protein (DUF1330 family)
MNMRPIMALAPIAASILLLAACATADGAQGAAAGAAAAEPKGYAIAEIAVSDPQAYKPYVAAVGPLVAKFGGAYVVRGGEAVAKEGDAPNGRIVVIEFPSLAAARAFYDSPEYQAILPLRLKAATARVYFVEGHAP